MIKSFLLSKLRLSDEEFTRGAWLFALFFLLINGIFFGRNARDSLFLVKVGLAFLPYAYMLNAVLAIGCSFLYAMFVDRIDRVKFVRIILILFVTFLGLTFAAVQLDAKWVYWAAYSIVQVIWLMSLMMFWTFAADFYDVAQSKRIFPLIGMGGLIGMITSGIAAKRMVSLFGTESLFVAWAVLLGIGIFIVGRLASHRPPAPAAAPARKKGKEPGQWERVIGGFRQVRQSPLLLNMVVLILALWIVFTLIDYQFNQVARAQYLIKDDLTAFLGIFRSWAGACCLAFQIFLTPLIIRKLGVAGAMAIHPAFLLLSVGSMTLSFGFLTGCVTKFGDHVLLYTASDVAYQLLFNPIPASKRGGARAFVEGYVKPFSMGLAGILLLLLLKIQLSPGQIAGINLAVVSVWLGAALMLRKNYLKAVVSNLDSGQPAAVTALSSLSPENSAVVVESMKKRLESGGPDDIVFAIEYFVLVKHEPAAPAIANLAGHPAHDVRQTVLNALSDLDGLRALPLAERALDDSDPRVIREALSVIRRHGGEDQLPALHSLRGHPDLAIVAESIETSVEVGGFDGILATADMLKTWANSGNPRELELLASILGRLKIKSFLSILLDLARHTDPRVSKSALIALTHFKDDRVLPTLVDGLHDEILFPAIQRHLSSLAEKHRNALIAQYRAVTERHRVRQRLFEAIARSERWDPSDILVEEMTCGDPVIRFLCVKHLDPAKSALPAARVTDLLRMEIEHWIRIVTLRDSLRVQGDQPPAANALDLVFGEELKRTSKTVFTALGWLGDRAAIRRVHQTLFHGAESGRAMAIEAFENMRLNPWTPILLPLLANAPVSAAQKEFQKSFPDAVFDADLILRDIASGAYDYLLSATLLFWRDTKDAGRARLVESLKSHASGLVREHAQAAADAIGGSQAC